MCVDCVHIYVIMTFAFYKVYVTEEMTQWLHQEENLFLGNIRGGFNGR